MITSKPRIFVVDDEPIIAMSLTTILCLKGYDAEQFTDPHLALEATASVSPDMLISDVMMPGLNGVELAIQIRARCPTCHVILISGQAATLDILAPARKQGHQFDLHAKPITPPTLLAIIHQAFPQH